MTDGRERADFYVTLGVGPLASYEEIRSAYRQLARRHHPDATASSASAPASRASAEMVRINAVYGQYFPQAPESKGGRAVTCVYVLWARKGAVGGRW